MMLELVFPYVSVAVVALFWALAMRPVLRLIHASHAAGATTCPRPSPARRPPTQVH